MLYSIFPITMSALGNYIVTFTELEQSMCSFECTWLQHEDARKQCVVAMH